MPKDAGVIYGYLAGEALRTRSKWIFFRQLFMDSDVRTKKLAKAGGLFFGEIQNILVFDLILSIARLTDPASTGKKDNLTLLQLISKLAQEKQVEITIALRNEYEKVEKLAEAVRAHRHKKVSHFDLVTIVKPESEPLPGLTLRDIRLAIESIEEFLGLVHTHYTGGSFMWSALTTRDDADTLFATLCKAECYDEAEAKGVFKKHEWEKFWE
ncbi:hypothetical protein [Nibricoccus aquaticus]|nr:hypothetical protein [Nibricoccus aquaticus]